MSNLSDFQKKFKVDNMKIYESNYWVWSLRPHQATLGAGVLSLKRECATFGELKSEEYCDLGNIIKVIESTLKQLFCYDKINYLMLMMVDKQVHYHIIPRYEKENEVRFFDRVWEDRSWPGIPNLAGDILGEDELFVLCSYIIRNLKIN